LRCVELAILNPAQPGEYRVFNQFTEIFSILQLAELVREQACKLEIAVEISHLENPRVELEEHHYNPTHTKLLSLGLEPHFLSDELVSNMIGTILKHKERIKREIILPKVKWNGKAREIDGRKLMWAGA
jgi:UDP-sulfoquinovose synthase